jgi:hypothetical protein
VIYTLVWSTQIMADIRDLDIDDAVHVTNNIMSLAREPYPIPDISTIKDAHGNEMYALLVEPFVVVYDIIEPSTVHLLGVRRL